MRTDAPWGERQSAESSELAPSVVGSVVTASSGENIERLSGIQRMFSTLVPEYERFNAWSSLGMDRVWRRRLLARIPGGGRVLDVGAGTGDLTRFLAQKSSWAVGLDFSYEMLMGARRSKPDTFGLLQASAAFLPIGSTRFDGVVSAFVLRNLCMAGVLSDSLREAHRVLKPGGFLTFLDLTRPSSGPMRVGHALYLRTLLPLIGRLSFGARWPGHYLRESIRTLDALDSLGNVFRDAGFVGFRKEPFFGGVVSFFSARKPC